MPSARSIYPHQMSDDGYALGARFGNPCLTLAAEHLTHVGVFPITSKALELLGCRIKAHDGIGCPLREPHLVIGIDPHGVRTRFLAGSFHCFQLLSVGS